MRAKVVVGDDELALAAIQRDATRRQRESKGAARCGDGEVENKVAPRSTLSEFHTAHKGKRQRTSTLSLYGK